MGSNVLMILGMHRSGTSLTANWLHHCGLVVGDDLMVGNKLSNAKGHYEDLEIYDLHKRILKDNKFDYLVGPNDSIRVKSSFKEEIRSIIKSRNNLHRQWGWKEPRTCLFVEEWRDELPGVKSLVVFRPFANVADSLARRMLKNNKNRRNKLKGFYQDVLFKVDGQRKKMLNKFLVAWIRYNKDLVSFVEKGKLEDVLVINTNKLKDFDSLILSVLIDSWGFDINRTAMEEIFESKLMVENKVELKFNQNLLHQAEQIWKKLEKLEEESIKIHRNRS